MPPAYPEHRIQHFCPGAEFIPDPENLGKSRMIQSRRFERPRSSRSQHSNPGGTRCLSSTSVAQVLAASIKVMDVLFGLVVRNDAEWSIGESFWDAHGVEIGA